MFVRKIILLVSVFFFLGYSSCEYNPHEENFREVDFPEPTHEFSLNLWNGNDTIRLFAGTQIRYDLQTFGLEITEGNITIGDQKWTFYSSSGSIDVDPDNFTPGFYTLNMTVYTNSGSGSIADVAGAEGYMMEREWVLLIDGRGDPPLTVSSRELEDGYLQVSWSKNPWLNFSHYVVKGYHNFGNFTRTITDVNDTTLIDSCFVGGDATYTVYSYISENEYSMKSHSPAIPVPVPQFQDLGIDSLRVYWDGLRSARYTLLEGSDTIFDDSGKTSVTIPSPGFGVYKDYLLTTSPVGPCTSVYGFTLREGRYHVLGQYLESNRPTYGYNGLENVVYTSTYDQVHCYDVSSLGLLKEFTIYQLIYQGMYSCPTNSTKVAALSARAITVFNDKTLQDTVSIPYDCFGKTIDYFYLTDNNMVAIALKSKIDLISVASKKVTLSIPIDDYPVYSSWACFSISADGRYATVVTYNGIKLFWIEDGRDSLVYSDSRVYRSALFDINDPARLMLTFRYDNKLEIRNIPDFSLDRTIDLPTNAEVLRNIDPESGFLLFTDYVNLHIIDLNVPEEIFSLPCTDTRPQLYSNRLFSQTGYSLDISQYLNK